MKPMGPFLLSLLLAAAAPPAAPPPELESLFARSASAPPELAAAILLRLAAHPGWPADLRLPVLEAAFTRAADARERLPCWAPTGDTNRGIA